RRPERKTISRRMANCRITTSPHQIFIADTRRLWEASRGRRAASGRADAGWGGSPTELCVTTERSVAEHQRQRTAARGTLRRQRSQNRILKRGFTVSSPFALTLRRARIWALRCLGETREREAGAI